MCILPNKHALLFSNFIPFFGPDNSHCHVHVIYHVSLSNIETRLNAQY